jgi:hypothetical protein
MLKKSEKFLYGHSDILCSLTKFGRKRNFVVFYIKRQKRKKNVFVPQRISFLREVLCVEIECLEVQNM